MTKKEIKSRLRQIKSQISSIARISGFMSEKQLAPYEMMAEEYEQLKQQLAEMKGKSNG